MLFSKLIQKQRAIATSSSFVYGKCVGNSSGSVSKDVVVDNQNLPFDKGKLIYLLTDSSFFSSFYQSKYI